MQTNTHPPIRSQQPRLRAMVEIVNGEILIFPIAQSDEEANRIMESLLLWKDRDA